MHAIQMRNFGPPLEVLEFIELAEPSVPAADEVLVGVEFAPINVNDLYLIEGVFPIRPTVPSVVGNEGVGRILSVGRDVRDLRVGDRVLIPLYAFSWRERMVLPAKGLFSPTGGRGSAAAFHAGHQSAHGSVAVA
jgi:NADPH:quinone reductase-like Zn-dependent oxidoreductase